MSGNTDPVAGGILIGVVLTLIVIRVFGARVLIRRNVMALSHDRTVRALLDAAAARGWSVLTVHHLHESLREAGYDPPATTVIEMCRPDYLASILQSHEAGAASVMMPCRLAVHETASGTVVVSRMNMTFVGWLFGGLARRVMTRAARASDKILTSVQGF